MIYGDALRNAMIPVITILGIVFGFLMAGNAVVESVFAWPGIGNYAVTALMTKDSGPIQSFVLFVAVMYVIVNLLVDLLYGARRSAHPAELMADAAHGLFVPSRACAGGAQAHGRACGAIQCRSLPWRHRCS